MKRACRGTADATQWLSFLVTQRPGREAAALRVRRSVLDARRCIIRGKPERKTERASECARARESAASDKRERHTKAEKKRGGANKKTTREIGGISKVQLKREVDR